MKNRLENIDEIFKQKFENFELVFKDENNPNANINFDHNVQLDSVKIPIITIAKILMPWIFLG